MWRILALNRASLFGAGRELLLEGRQAFVTTFGPSDYHVRMCSADGTFLPRHDDNNVNNDRAKCVLLIGT